MGVKFSKPNIFANDLNLVKKTIKSGWLTHGKNTTKFEKKFKKYYRKNWQIASTMYDFNFMIYKIFKYKIINL